MTTCTLTHPQLTLYRLFADSRESPKQLRMDQVKAAFPHLSENVIRKRLKLFANFERFGSDFSNYGCWLLRPDFRLPSEEEIRDLITPEQFCAHASMRSAEQRLKVGVSLAWLNQQEDCWASPVHVVVSEAGLAGVGVVVSEAGLTGVGVVVSEAGLAGVGVVVSEAGLTGVGVVVSEAGLTGVGVVVSEAGLTGMGVVIVHLQCQSACVNIVYLSDMYVDDPVLC